MALHVLLPDPISNLTAARREWAAVRECACLGVDQNARQRERIAACWAWLKGIQEQMHAVDLPRLGEAVLL